MEFTAMKPRRSTSKVFIVIYLPVKFSPDLPGLQTFIIYISITCLRSI